MEDWFLNALNTIGQNGKHKNNLLSNHNNLINTRLNLKEVQIIKALGLSQIMYLSNMLPFPDDKLKEIENIFYN